MERINFEFDIAIDAIDVVEYAAAFLPRLFSAMQKHDVLFSVKEWNGPGGGNPLFVLNGTKEAIANVIDEALDGDDIYHELLAEC